MCFIVDIDLPHFKNDYSYTISWNQKREQGIHIVKIYYLYKEGK